MSSVSIRLTSPPFLIFFLYLLLLQNCRGKGHQEQRRPGYHRVFSPFPNYPSLLLMEERCNIYNITLLSLLSTCTSRNQLAPRKGSCRSQGAHAKVLLPIYIHQPNPESRRKVLKSRARQVNPEYFADQERPVCAVLHTPGPCYTTLFFRQIRRFFYFVQLRHLYSSSSAHTLLLLHLRFPPPRMFFFFSSSRRG